MKAILRTKTDVKRVTLKDTINYCNVLFDGNIRKPLCRFYFNNPDNKFIAFFDSARKETKIHIDTIDDIYLHADKIESTLDFYLSAPAKEPKKNQDNRQETE